LVQLGPAAGIAAPPSARPRAGLRRHLRGAAGLAAGLGAVLIASGPAAADPPVSSGAEGGRAAISTGGPPGGRISSPALDALGLFDTPLDNPLARAMRDLPQPAWSITPSIGLQLTSTDNVRNSADNRRGDVYLALTPAISASANTFRLNGQLTYNPTARFYGRENELDRLDHRFSGSAHAMLIEDAVFLDMMGYATVVDSQGGLSPQNADVANRQNAVQTTMLQVSPYVMHRFGGDATVRLGYGFRQTIQDGQSAFLPGSTQPYFVSNNTTAHETYAVIRSGENFGRLALESRTTATTYSGNGALDGAHRYISTVEARYAVTRWFAPLVEVGYEDQRYGGSRPFAIQEPVWSVGMRLTPDRDSIIILRYGRRDGYDSASLNARVALGGRTTLSARYSDQIGTALQRSGDSLANGPFDEHGNTLQPASFGPTVAPFANSLMATQSNISRTKRAAITLSQSWPRDRISLSLLYDDRQPITSTSGTAAFAQRGLSLGLSWSHDLTERTTSSAYIQAGRNERPNGSGGGSGGGDSSIYTLRLRLHHAISLSTVGWIEYGLSHRGNELSGGDTTQNLITIGLRQFF
jgi:uncharacterized protein (PEP-CTERM system associated)